MSVFLPFKIFVHVVVVRLSILEAWRGLRDEELSQVSGIEGCTFVHSSGFIGGNKTKQGVLEMATKTLKGSR